MKNPCEPMLGCATTEQLLQELEVRGRMDMNEEFGHELSSGAQRLARILPKEMLEYRTVDS